MKKFMILTLCLLMLAGTALAGTTNEITPLSKKYNLIYNGAIEGVKSITVEDVYDMKTLTYELEDESMPQYTLYVSYSDMLHEMDITDMSDEEIAAVVALTALDSETHLYDVIEMEDGWPGVLIDYGDAYDWVDAFTIISGYFVQVHGAHADFSPLTQAENDFAFTLLDSVEVAAAE